MDIETPAKARPHKRTTRCATDVCKAQCTPGPAAMHYTQKERERPRPRASVPASPAIDRAVRGCPWPRECTRHATSGQPRPRQMNASDEIGDIHRHLVNLGGVVLLNVAQDADVVRFDKVDRHALAAEAARAADAVDVQLAVVGQIVANDQ
eukprot:6918564-Prymnesium_polylepis.2